MPGAVGNGEDFVTERRDKQQVHLRKDTGHFLCNLAAKTICLDEIYGGKEAGLAEKVGPGVGCLNFKLTIAMTERQLLEG